SKEGRGCKRERCSGGDPGGEGVDRLISMNKDITYSNVDGLVSKRDDVDIYRKNRIPDIMCMVETKLTRDISNEIFGWEDYVMWRRDRGGRYGGGVLVATKSCIKVNKIDLGEVNA
ncbi:hypothetical protein, partial [Klebsiella pneumoniae]|uniref:hypothetical protein n=1 Tax=Klebsiella pneumoniae TaxID=573 RepID=UPI003EBE15EB